jgi:hypothetical protein
MPLFVSSFHFSKRDFTLSAPAGSGSLDPFGWPFSFFSQTHPIAAG